MARFERMTVYQRMIDTGVIPLFYHADVGVAQNIAGALARSGANVIEFTNRGDFAIEVFSALAKSLPDVILGVGTVDDAATAALYLAHGANFVVGPTFVEDVARVCNRRKVAYLPGCATVNEVARAEEWGAEIVKLFPGNLAGPDFIKAITAPRPWTKIMPSGGVSADEANLRAWFDAGACCVGMGSNLVRADWVKAGDFAAIEAAARGAVETIKGVRKQPR
ncbi:MAG: bifunctional 4-hydroxy-2-oxoglutarate aldolase/2-dehydro-3-deoxy-phosphogluconate aldolase [Anaerolinea sp.]|nr:bifunctional 4-hydroxy-2-oxoglutarate aldolase/2-dehydro-3-deoxy-phosphogluconate aldolase [Anaerolinea sp.]